MQLPSPVMPCFLNAAGRAVLTLLAVLLLLLLSLLLLLLLLLVLQLLAARTSTIRSGGTADSVV